MHPLITHSSQFKPVVTASVGANKVGSGITADGLNAEVQIETEVSSPARVIVWVVGVL